MRGRKRIDWDFITEGYNYHYKTNLNATQMLQRVYDEIGSVIKMERFLGPSHMAIYDEMKRRPIKIQPKGHRWPSRLLLKILCMDCRALTARQIAKTINCTRLHAYKLLNKNGVVFKRVKNNNNTK